MDLLNNWALHNRAKAIKKFLPNHEIEIRSGLGRDDWQGDQHLFDVIHFNFTWGITEHYDFIRKNNKRCLITLVNERSPFEGVGVNHPLMLDIVKNARYKTAVNRKLSTAYEAAYIPNGIDSDIFMGGKRAVVGYAGTNKPNKNNTIIREACEELGLEFRGAFYHGDTAVKSVDVIHESMMNFYLGLDVFVHVSLTEGFSNTVIEALSCNIPVIMSKQGAWEEFEGYAEFIEPTKASLMAALKKYTGRRLIDQRFTWKTIIPLYEKEYKTIHENNNRVQASADSGVESVV